MKNLMRFLSIFALVAVIAFSMAGCEIFPNDDPDGNGNGGNGGNGGSNTPGSTKENAILVTVGYSSSHTISSSGQHWFKFTGTGETIIFETTGNVVDTVIFDAKYMLPQRDDNSGEGYNALYCFQTTLGETSFIYVKPKSNTSGGTYTFIVKAPTVNIRTNPIPVSVGNTSSHTISSNGQHWFIFQGNDSNVIFNTVGNVVTTSIGLFIGNSTSAILTDNTKISFSTVSGTTYYIRITGNSGTYTFNVQSGTGDGSTKTYAIPVMVGYSSSHTIISSGTHWFSFLGTGETVTFETTGNVVDTVIYDDKYILPQRDDNSGEGYNARYSFKTTLGETSFIYVKPKSGTSGGTYTFIVK